MTNPTFDQIKYDIENNDVLLYMKGTPEMPKCGFSSVVASILAKFDLDFKSIDVLASDEIRESIKIFSDWPTIPQLYIKGEFIGGCDIVKEMHASGELENLLKEKNII